MRSEEHISAVVPVLGSFSAPDLATVSGREHARSFVPSPATSFAYSKVKRLIDVVFVLAAVPLWLPLCIALSLLVRLTSSGPVFYSHRRIGHHGAFFSMWKFRTMCVNSAEVLEQHLAMHPEDRAEWAATHKLKNDPRITPLGRFLRQTSLDELPQLWDVLTGRMSLVGPRPIVAAEAEKYGTDLAYYLAVVPGITGLWQTSGRSTLSYEERVALDRRYVEEWSLQMDLLLLLRTVNEVANSEGAY
jgi:lipopolysaccharide/colanic/teichoic acid biosynthesis glycosyltransferase